MKAMRLLLLAAAAFTLSLADLYCSDGSHSSCASDCAGAFGTAVDNAVRHCLTWCKDECTRVELEGRRRLQGSGVGGQCLAAQVVDNVDTLDDHETRITTLEGLVAALQAGGNVPGPVAPVGVLGFIETKLQFKDANTACMMRGYSRGTVAIDSASKNQMVLDFVMKECKQANSDCNVWLGGYDHSGQNSDWRWISGDPIKYTNWKSGEPNNSGNTNEACIAMFVDANDPNKSGNWNDSSCDNKHYVVCEGTQDDFATAGQDPTDWVHIEIPLPFWDANNACVARGYRGLAIADSQQIDDQLQTLQDQSDASKDPWIGAYDHSGANSDWKWLDGSQVVWDNWNPNEPNGASEQCAHKYSSGGWNDRNCSSKERTFFCEGSPDPVWAPKWGVITEALTFEDAQNACRARGFSRGLAKVRDAQTNTDLWELVKQAVDPNDAQNRFWIALYDHSTSNDDWKWMDGEPLDGGYQNWNPGEPNGAANERCGMMRREDGTWNDLNCDVKEWALCMG